MARFVFGILIPLFLLATSAALAENPAIAFEPCGPEGAEDELECGILRVPEDPVEPEGRSIPLRIVVAPALEPREGAPAQFLLEGGPGIAVSRTAERSSGRRRT
jgi:hypothetical protein